MLRLFYLCVIGFILGQVEVKGQDPIFSQFYAAPLQVNPAFAGNTYAPFIALNYRNQWSGFDDFKTYTTYAASYSQFVEHLNSGVGLRIETDNAGAGILKTTALSGFYSYKVDLKQYSSIKFGVEASFVQKRVDWDQLVFADQIDPLGETSFMSEEVRPEQLGVNYVDLGIGMLFYNPTFYGGVAIKHINRPDEGILGINGNIGGGLPVRFSVHGGMQLEQNRGNKRKPTAFISPNVLFVKQADFAQINAGAYMGFGSFFAGGWYRHAFTNGDAIIGLIGFRKGIFKMGYSFDFAISELSSVVGVTHEFSITMNFDTNRPRRINYNDCLQLFR